MRCDWHKKRQAVEQAIYMEIGKFMAGMTICELCRQPIYTFSEDYSTLLSIPAGCGIICDTSGMDSETGQ